MQVIHFRQLCPLIIRGTPNRSNYREELVVINEPNDF